MKRDNRDDKNLRQFYTVVEVQAITTLSRATIYRKMQRGTFPLSVSISENRVGWDRQSIEEWCRQRRGGA